MEQCQRRGIVVVGFVVGDKLRRSGIGLKYVAPMELADFYFGRLQICRADGAGEGNQLNGSCEHLPKQKRWKIRCL